MITSIWFASKRKLRTQVRLYHEGRVVYVAWIRDGEAIEIGAHIMFLTFDLIWVSPGVTVGIEEC